MFKLSSDTLDIFFFDYFQNEQQMAKEFTKAVQDAEQTYQVFLMENSCRVIHFGSQINRIYNGVEAETRISPGNFQMIQVLRGSEISLSRPQHHN